MYAAILHLTFPPARHDEVAAFLRDEMLPVIREDSALASQHEDAAAVHARYAELGITVASATRYGVLATS